MRAADDDMIVEGYAAVFDSVTDLGAFKERIAPGAFSDVLDNDVRLLINHDGVPLARTSNNTLELSQDDTGTSNNTLELSQDDTGLYYRAMLSDTQAGKDLYTMIKRGDISQSSFAFTIGRESVDDEGVRVIEQVSNLIDVSPVTYPAYQAASVFARSESEFEND
jgi:phage head maturation protease